MSTEKQDSDHFSIRHLGIESLLVVEGYRTCEIKLHFIYLCSHGVNLSYSGDDTIAVLSRSSEEVN